MADIATTQARGEFTQAVAATFSDRIRPMGFGRSFFTEVETNSKYVSIEVQRNNEKIAVDVVRGTEGNRNTWSKSTQKIFLPSYFREFFDVTELDLYESLYVNPIISAVNFGNLILAVSEKMDVMRDKIDRAYELYCWQVLLDGILQTKTQGNIDFKRKAESLVDLEAGNYWADSGVDPNTTFETGAKFLRETGKMQGSVINIIMGAKAWDNYMANAAVRARGIIYNYSMDMLSPQVRTSVGASYHGSSSAGAYTFRFWSYPEVYTDATGASVQYMDQNKIVMLPEKTNFILSYAAVPQIIMGAGGGYITPQAGKWLVSEEIDTFNVSHKMDVKSAGLAVPVAVDQIYTAQVVAS